MSGLPDNLRSAVQNLRGVLDLTQEAFARRLNVSLGTVARWEMSGWGISTPMLNRLWMIAVGCGSYSSAEIFDQLRKKDPKWVLDILETQCTPQTTEEYDVVAEALKRYRACGKRERPVLIYNTSTNDAISAIRDIRGIWG